MAFQPVINVNHINRCSAQPLGTGLAPGRLWAHYRCSWHGGAAFLAFSLCPLTVGAALAPSILVARRKGDGVKEEEGMSLNAPITPQNEIDKLPEVIAPSTIFFGRKYCYRQIGDSISCRRWGSRLWSKGCVCPLLSRLRCLLMLYLLCLSFSRLPTPLFFLSKPYFFPPMSVPSAAFTFHILLPHHALPHSIRLLIGFLAPFL